MIDFEFPSLEGTGEGEPVYPPGTSHEDFVQGEHPLYAYVSPEFYVTYQLDRPTCAFRCYYPGGSSPCRQETADRFIQWAKEKVAL